MFLPCLPLPIEGFTVKETVFCDIPSYLIYPDKTAEVKVEWNKDNLIYRSLIVRQSDLFVLSSGYPNFFNAFEKPGICPDVKEYEDWVITEKCDGSLCILDYIPGYGFSMRTRGIVSYITQTNSEDFEILFKKYPKLLDCAMANKSLLFELVTPNNVIVIRSSEIDFIFLGAINKDDLSVCSVEDTKDIALSCGLRTPRRYAVGSLEELVNGVKEWIGQEGVVLSFNNNKNRIKIKSDWYKVLHSIKSQLNSDSNLIEYYVDNGMPKYNEFYSIIESSFDYEIAESYKDKIKVISVLGARFAGLIDKISHFIHDIRGLSRKEQAREIIQMFPEDKGLAFFILDGKEIPKKNELDYLTKWNKMEK